MKKPIVIGSIIFAVVVIGVGGFVLKTKLLPEKKVLTETPIVTVAPKDLLLWEDPAGFSFKYPSDLSINKHDEDTQNYAHLEITSKTHTGSILLWAKDTTNTTVSTWIKNDKTLVGAISVDTTLGKKEAKKLVLSGPPKKLITGVIDDAILFTVEVNPQTDETYWNELYTDITQTFTFATSTNTTVESNQSPVEESGQADEEEVLE